MKKRSLVLAALGALLFLVAPKAGAQADFQQPGATPRRVNRNSDPLNQGSGRTQLRWYVPNGIALTTTITLDNTDYQNTLVNPPFTNGPFQPNIYGVVTAHVASSSSIYWTSPPNVAGEASDPYLESISAGVFGTIARNSNSRTPDYVYTTCTPSAPNQTNPTVAENPAKLSWFDWQFNPPAQQEQFYALYVWLPIGPTTVSTASVLYPQRYYVYQITYGNNYTYTDVVDTYATGFGFVRLGNGGLPTDAVFPYDGIHPIHIRLFNTVPRDANGVLSTGNETTASNYVVYADAAQAVPTTGAYVASPTSAYQLNSSGAPVVDSLGDPDVNEGVSSTPAWYAQITAAENELSSGFRNNQYQVINKGVVKTYRMNPYRWAQPPVITTVNNVSTVTTPGVPDVLWRYSPLEQNAAYTDTLVTGGNGVTPTAAWSADVKNPHFQGSYYLSTTITTAAATQAVTYLPGSTSDPINPGVLEDGSYQIFAYIPGNGGGETYGQTVQYQIWEGTTLAYTGYLNEQQASGWVQLGVRHYIQAFKTSSANLKVLITNNSTTASDSGLLVYANAVKFVGAANLAINSTPLHAQVNIKKSDGTTALTEVVIVADESGRIHCLDFIGNGDGTTQEYWSYPSIPNPNITNWTDPNLQGIDGPVGSTVPVATMPSGFNLSSALVVKGVDPQAPANDGRLYIGSTNGRIYCIDMTGRGDYTPSNGAPGTTQRLWSYPNDYPTVPTVPSALGPFGGSLVYGDTTDGVAAPTIFAPAAQGRIYAINALGNTTARTTAVNWTFPSITGASLPPIQMTPTLAFGKLFFGTLQDPNNDGPGQFYALSVSNSTGVPPGQVVWSFDGTGATNGYLVNNTVSTVNTYQTGESVSNFIAGPVTAPAALLTPNTGTYAIAPQVNSIYILNDDLYLYGFNADTGAPLVSSDGTLYYHTNELGVTSTQNLAFNSITTYDRFGFQRSFPVVMVPTSEGHVYGMFARVDDYNIFTVNNGTSAVSYPGLNAWGTSTVGIPTSLAISNRRMIIGDSYGYLSSFDDNSQNLLGYDVYGTPPDSVVLPPNEPGVPDAFRYIKITLMNQAGYQALRSVLPNGQGSLDYNDATSNPAYLAAQPPSGQSSLAFEWGETAYILVHDFPYATVNQNGTPVQAPIVNISISVSGKVVRQLQVDARQFAQSPAASPEFIDPRTNMPIGNPATGNPYLMDGYGILAFTFQGGGANALPPGPGTIRATITTAAAGTTSGATEIESDPDPGYAMKNFNMANPLGLEVVSNPTNVPHYMGVFVGTTGNVNTYPYDPISLANGSPAVPDAHGSEIFSQFLSSLGYATDNSTQTASMFLYDRSLMTNILPPGQGLTGVRVQRNDMAWEGGTATQWNALNPTLYPGFEDQPTQIPNVSLDYPNIPRDAVTFTKDPNGNAQNPLLVPVTLDPPLDGTTLGAYTTSSNPLTRVVVPVPLNIQVNVPKYQPPVNDAKLTGTGTIDNPDDFFTAMHDSAGIQEPQGYRSEITVFVDSLGTGQYSTQDAFRSFRATVGVVPSYRVSVSTPNVDLGALPTGTGYTPQNPSSQNLQSGLFSPWNESGPWTNINGGVGVDAYQPFTVLNDSNVNLTDIRLAKASLVGVNSKFPLDWQFLSPANDQNAWLDATYDVHSNIGSDFAMPNPNGGNAVMLQKPRIGDLSAISLNVNPWPRLNPNTGATGSHSTVLNPAFPSDTASESPRVAVSVPFGFPAGNYSAILRVIDATVSGSNDEIWEPWQGAGLATEPYSDPGLNISFTSREARVTNTNTQFDTTMADLFPLGPPVSTSTSTVGFSFSNTSPAAMRDALGSVIAAWSSNRGTFNNGVFTPYYTPPANTFPLTTPPPLDPSRIYVASVPNAANFQQNGITPPQGQTYQSPIADLNFFQGDTANGRWFIPQTQSGYPTNPTALFPTDSMGAPITGTETFDLPAFPLSGEKDPLTGAAYSGTWMAYVGAVQKQGPTGRIGESEVFMTQVKTGSGGSVTMDASGAPITNSLPADVADPLNPGNPRIEDPLTLKGKPSVIQDGTGAFLFYPVTSAGQTSIHVDRVLPSGSQFAPPIALDFGGGFESVTSPSASLRPYQGYQLRTNPATMPNQVINLTFAGKLRGRPNYEIYMSELRVGTGSYYHLIDASGLDVETNPKAGSPFVYLAAQSNERLQAEGNGTFRARGVDWDRTQPIALTQYLNGTPVDLLVEATRNVDSQSGIVSYDTRLGGKVYIDPEMGTVRFSSGVPNVNVEIRLTYTPGFLRVTAGGSQGYSAPTGIYDQNFASDPTEWFEANGTPIRAGDTVNNDRFMFLFGKNAGGTGQTTRPFLSTMRLGLRLPTRIATGTNGLPLFLQVTGNTGPYQIDPANGRVYFTAVDEDQPVTINYTGLDDNLNNLQGQQAFGNVSFVLEHAEDAVKIDQPVDEANLNAFLDPFTFNTGSFSSNRPSLVWMFYTSTRAGGPDVYFQTIAPRFSPIIQ